MHKIIHGEFSIKINGDNTFLDGISEAEVFIYEKNQYQKFKIIYSEKNDKLLIVNVSLDKVQSIYSKDFATVYKFLIKNATVFKNKRVQELLLRQTDTTRTRTDDNGLERIGDVFSIVQNEREITKINKDFVIYAEDSYKIVPDKLMLIHQDASNAGEIRLNTDGDYLQKIRFFQDFEICIVKYEETLETICVTLYTDMRIEDNQFVFKFSDELSIVGNSRLSGLSANVRNPLELIDYMLSKMNFNFEIPDYEYRERSFLCVIPISGLKIKEVLGLGTVEFVPRGYLEVENSVFKDILAANNSETFSKVYLTASSYNKAGVLANELTNKAIDFLYHIQRLDSLYLYKGNKNPFWSRQNYKTIDLTSQILIQDTISNEYICSLDESEERDSLNIDLEKIDQTIESISWYENCLTNEMDGQTKKNIKTIFIAIRYLRKSWDSRNLDEKLINTSVAYEFMLEDEKVEKFLDRSARRLIAENSKKIALDILKEEDREIKSQKIFERVNYSLSTPILDQKLMTLLNRLNLSLTKLDQTILKDVRDMRNELVHGRGLPNIDVKKINLANGIIAYLLLNKLKDRVD